MHKCDSSWTFIYIFADISVDDYKYTLNKYVVLVVYDWIQSGSHIFAYVRVLGGGRVSFLRAIWNQNTGLQSKILIMGRCRQTCIGLTKRLLVGSNNPKACLSPALTFVPKRLSPYPRPQLVNLPARFIVILLQTLTQHRPISCWTGYSLLVSPWPFQSDSHGTRTERFIILGTGKILNW